MSVVNVSNFLVELNKKISNTSNDKELLMLTKALEKLKTGVVFTVGTFANLPDPTENVGKLYFVEADALLYFSFITDYGSVSQWIPITNVSVNALWSWGFGGQGELGNGTTVNKCSPGTIVGGGSTWCDISSRDNVLAIKTDGTLWTWGNNCCGQLGDGTTIGRCSPGTVAGGGTNWKILGNPSFSPTKTAIKIDGTLWTWGYNVRGGLGDGTTITRCSPGTVAGGGTTWCQVSSFGNNACQHSSAIKTDGTLWTWGDNSLGRLGDGTTVSRCSPGTVAGGGTTWCQVSSGSVHSAAIKTDGTLWTWGNNFRGGLGDGTTVSRCSPGTVSGGGTTWCFVNSVASQGAIAIKTDGTIWTWGCNERGILGDGTTVERCSPGTVAGGGTTWCQISGGYTVKTAIKTDGTIWTWGYNTQGQLGDGTTVSRCSPGTIVGGGNNWFKSSVSNAITKETL